MTLPCAPPLTDQQSTTWKAPSARKPSSAPMANSQRYFNNFMVCSQELVPAVHVRLRMCTGAVTLVACTHRQDSHCCMPGKLYNSPPSRVVYTRKLCFTWFIPENARQQVKQVRQTLSQAIDRILPLVNCVRTGARISQESSVGIHRGETPRSAILHTWCVAEQPGPSHRVHIFRLRQGPAWTCMRHSFSTSGSASGTVAPAWLHRC